jgi:hypothetical protein
MCGMIGSAGSGAILPLMTLKIGNFVTVLTGFAVGTVEAGEFRLKINHYRYLSLEHPQLFLCFTLTRIQSLLPLPVHREVRSELRIPGDFRYDLNSSDGGPLSILSTCSLGS